ncbi:MAG: hypothetical protein J7L61_03850, partial [Thermoplasmata archaeon]|nr:hypothetical protein [Thermoplasmata archaeon]
IVSGAPGTGKTLLAFQYALEGGEKGEPSLVVTLEEGRGQIEGNLPPGLLSRLDAVRDNIYFLDLGALRKISPSENGEEKVSLGLETMGDIISRWSRERKLKRCVLDGLGAVVLLYSSDAEFRSALFHLAAKIRSSGVTALFTMESLQGAEDMRRGVEEYVADGILSLSHSRGLRHIQVLKMRGKGFLGGWHEMEITDSGVHVYPRRFHSPANTSHGPAPLPQGGHTGEGTSSGRTPPVRGGGMESFGAREMDGLLGGGIFPWEIVALSGSPGTGKTALSLLYLAEAIRKGKKALLVSMKHSKKDIFNMADHWGFDLRKSVKEGTLRMLTPNPLGMLPYKHLLEIERNLEGVSRVVVDAVNDYEMMCRDTEKGPSFEEYISQLVSLLREHGVSGLLISDSREIMGSTLAGEMPVMYYADTGLLLRYVELKSEFKKAVMVLKRRMGAHSRDVVEIDLAPGRITLGGKFEGVEGVMTGKATREEERLERFFG